MGMLGDAGGMIVGGVVGTLGDAGGRIVGGSVGALGGGGGAVSVRCACGVCCLSASFENSSVSCFTAFIVCCVVSVGMRLF